MAMKVPNKLKAKKRKIISKQFHMYWFEIPDRKVKCMSSMAAGKRNPVTNEVHQRDKIIPYVCPKLLQQGHEESLKA
jgi:hypothetical protein